MQHQIYVLAWVYFIVGTIAIVIRAILISRLSAGALTDKFYKSLGGGNYYSMVFYIYSILVAFHLVTL